MFAEVYKESLEGALRREGPAAVLADMQEILIRLAPELDDVARMRVQAFSGTLLQNAAWMARASDVLRHGLNKRLTEHPVAA